MDSEKKQNITCSYILIFVSVCFLNASLSRTCRVLNGVYFIVNFIFAFICNTWLTWFFLKQHLLHDIVVGFIFKVMAQEFLVFEWFLHILYLLVPPQWTVGTQRWHLSINIHRSKTEINIAMVFREETTHWDEVTRNFIENKYVSRKFIN